MFFSLTETIVKESIMELIYKNQQKDILNTKSAQVLLLDNCVICNLWLYL